MRSILTKEEFWFTVIAGMASAAFFLAGIVVRKNSTAYRAEFIRPGYSPVIKSPHDSVLFSNYVVSGHYLVHLPGGDLQIVETGGTFLTRIEKPGTKTIVYMTPKGKLFSARWIREQKKLGFIVLAIAGFLLYNLIYHIIHYWN